jgi:hypothetical protein
MQTSFVQKRTFKHLICAILLCCAISVVAQDGTYVEVRDLETWSTIKLEYKPNKKWTLGLEEQLRLKDNSSTVNEYFTQFEVGYKVLDNLELGGALRYIRENDDQGNIQGYENHFRFHLDATYKYKFGGFRFNHRVRYQNKNELGLDEIDGDYVKHTLRFKTGFRYKIKNWKFDPKVSAEVFHRSEELEDNGFNKIRFTLGTDYKIKGAGKIGLFYRMENQLNVSYPKTTNIIGFKYTYTLKPKKK